MNRSAAPATRCVLALLLAVVVQGCTPQPRGMLKVSTPASALEGQSVQITVTVDNVHPEPIIPVTVRLLIRAPVTTYFKAPSRIAERSYLEPVRAAEVRGLASLDRGTFIGSVEKTGRAVVVHEAPRTNGFGAEIVAQINEHALLQLQAPVQRVTGFDTVFPLSKLEHHYLPNRGRVVEAVRKTLEF